MSVYGGDSWVREAQHRKRRVEELMTGGLDSSSFKKLSNGKFTCLVCPNHPILDSSLMISMHSTGARHRAALSKLMERELMKQEEINKRMAMSGHPTTSINPGSSAKKPRLANKRLIEHTQKVASEIVLHSGNPPQDNLHGVNSSTSIVHHAVEPHHHEGSTHCTSESSSVIAPQKFDFRELREKELKFTAAGWKRDGHGKWYRDENVEFDSDEEDPNVCLA